MRSRLSLLILVLCLALAAWPFAALPVRADCGLNNNSFEGAYPDHFGDGRGLIAPDWQPWYQDGPDQAFGKNWRPTYGGFDTGYLGGARVHGGTFSQKFGTQWATHNAGVYQRVAVPRDSQVTFSAWSLVWSSNGDDPTAVTEPGNYRVYVGIDPTGGTNWAAPSVRWSEPRIEYNTWMQLSISARAEADAVTVFVRGQPDYPVKNNESTWDDTCLSVVPPTPRPTNTPRATNTPLPTNTPTKTATPTLTATPSATATPVTGSICLQTFNDKNGNGKRDDGEELLTGARFAVLDANKVEVASQPSVAEPYCFGGLVGGDYAVKITLPAGYAATTPLEWALTLPPGGSLKVDTGLKALPTPTPPPTPTPVPPQSPLASLGQGILGISGILLALVAIALPIGLRYLRSKE